MKTDLHEEYDPNYLAYDEWLVEENEAGNRVAAFTRVESRITEEWRAEWLEEFCEADLLDEDELAELELQYLHDRYLLAKREQKALLASELFGFGSESEVDSFIRAKRYRNQTWLEWQQAIPVSNNL